MQRVASPTILSSTCGDGLIKQRQDNEGVGSTANKPIPPQLAQLLASADPETRSRLEPRLARAVSACGCSSGSVALLLGSALAVLWWLTQRDGRVVMWREAAIAAVAVVVGTLLAKLGGILFARVWIAWTRRRLERRFASSAWEST